MHESLGDILRRLAAFRDERDWAQFHTPGALAAAISVEAAELQELFLWKGPDEQAQVVEERSGQVAEELADVLITAFNFALATGIDPMAATQAKIDKNERRYPVDLARGNAIKYTDR